MGQLRASLRLVAIVIYTTMVCVRVALGLPFIRGGAAGHLRWHSANCQRWARGMCRIIGMSVDVEGAPPAHGVVVANHLGYCDVFLLGSCFPTSFIAKSELSGWPLLGTVARSGGTLFVERARLRDIPRVFEAVTARLRAGQSVVMFPEGTSTDGTAVLPFKSSLLAGAAAEHHPVSFAALAYETPPGWPRAGELVAWWGDATLLPHLWHLLQIPKFRGTVRFGAEPIVEGDRKALARRLHRGVTSLLSDTRVKEDVWAQSH